MEDFGSTGLQGWGSTVLGSRVQSSGSRCRESKIMILQRMRAVGKRLPKPQTCPRQLKLGEILLRGFLHIRVLYPVVPVIRKLPHGVDWPGSPCNLSWHVDLVLGLYPKPSNPNFQIPVLVVVE